MQWLTEMHKSHAPESPPCLPGVTTALRVWYHHLVSLGCNPSTIPSPPAVGLSQIRDKNSGECFWISRTDFICSVLIERGCWMVDSTQKAHALSGYVIHRKREPLDCAGDLTFPTYVWLCISLWTCGKFLLFCSQPQWWIPYPQQPREDKVERGRGGESDSRDPQILFQDLLWSKCALSEHKLRCLQSVLSSSAGHQQWKGE